MIKPSDPRQLAIDLIPRSICSVQVGAAVCDASGNIISWGWNSVGNGFGLHAEAHAIRRANQARLWYGAIYVASQRKRTGKAIISKPCPECRAIIDKWHLDVVWRDRDGRWIYESGLFGHAK